VLFPVPPFQRIARRNAEDDAFGERCEAIFAQVAPKLMPFLPLKTNIFCMVKARNPIFGKNRISLKFFKKFC